MNYPTHLHDRLTEIEQEYATDPSYRRPAPFIRLRGLKDRSPSLKAIRNMAARMHIDQTDAIDPNGAPIPEFVAKFRPNSSTFRALSMRALEGSDVEFAPTEAS